MLRYAASYNDDPESWTSSINDMMGAMMPEMSYTSNLSQSQHIPAKINPLLRRNQYWVWWILNFIATCIQLQETSNLFW